MVAIIVICFCQSYTALGLFRFTSLHQTLPFTIILFNIVTNHRLCYHYRLVQNFCDSISIKNYSKMVFPLTDVMKVKRNFSSCDKSRRWMMVGLRIT